MKYFTKWVKKPGPIEIDDYAIPELTDTLVCQYMGGNKWINDHNEELNLPNWQDRFGFQKVELMLCTGDKLPFKVVAKLWPIPDWVKAEMLFDDTQIGWKVDDGSDHIIDLTEIDEDDIQTFKNAVFTLKCPGCGRYH
jgi:hypothetical protein